MRISSIKGPLSYISNVCAIAMFACCVYKGYNDKTHQNEIKHFQTEIKSNDLNRYINCLEDLNSQKGLFDRMDDWSYWREQVKEMKDSISLKKANAYLGKEASKSGLNAVKKVIK